LSPAYILREKQCEITPGRLLGGGKRAKAEIADYVLVYRNTKLATIEAIRARMAYGQRRKVNNIGAVVGSFVIESLLSIRRCALDIKKVK
jgi:predicted Fe-S protein YdhL (DUF1289 family)